MKAHARAVPVALLVGLAGCGSEAPWDPGFDGVYLERPPARPTEGGPGDGPGYAFVVDELFVGDTDGDGLPDDDAYRRLGYDLDGRISDRDSTNLCALAVNAAPSSTYPDGDGGIDNAFVKNVLPAMGFLDSAYTVTMGASVASGERSYVVSLPTLGSSSSYTSLPAHFLQAAGPLDGGAWSIGAQSYADAVPRWSTPNAYLVDDTLVMGPDLTLRLWLPVGGGESVGIDLHHAILTMHLDPARLHADSGVVAGIIETDALLAVLQTHAGHGEPSFCNGITFETFSDLVRMASDIGVDGEQDPSTTCGGISLGFGFSATRVPLGDVVPAPPEAPPACP